MSDVSEWFQGRSRILFVHAHPDDETITTGGTLAALAEAGREPLLVTLTRGERGEVVPGPLQALAQAHGLAVVRQNELKTALGMLGVERHAFLGVEPARAEGRPPVIYEDSGMRWAAPTEDATRSTAEPVGPSSERLRATAALDAGPDALTSVPAAEPLNDLLAAAYLAGAQGIVSYDGGGGYGHPDHVFAHRAARAVAASLELPFWEILPEPPEGDAPGVELHEVGPWIERKLAALRAHATQLAVEPVEAGHDIVHVGGQREPVATREAFALRPAAHAGRSGR